MEKLSCKSCGTEFGGWSEYLIKSWQDGCCFCMSVFLWDCFVFLMCSVALSCPTVLDPKDCSPPGSSVHGDSPGKNTGVCCHTLLQGIFPTQRSNPYLRPYGWFLYHLSHQESWGILEWLAYPFCRETSWPRSRTEVSCTAGGFFTSKLPHFRLLASDFEPKWI